MTRIQRESLDVDARNRKTMFVRGEHSRRAEVGSTKLGAFFAGDFVACDTRKRDGLPCVVRCRQTMISCRASSDSNTAVFASMRRMRCRTRAADHRQRPFRGDATDPHIPHAHSEEKEAI
jgi:hypothetical protein